jgi:hypothetical protein
VAEDEDVGRTSVARSCAVAIFAALGLPACGSSAAGPPGDAGVVVADTGTAETGPLVDGGSPPADGGTADALSSCVPALPHPAWTSPYAGWTHGIPTDPSFFPLAAWLQGSWHATELSQLGINIYVGNNAGTDPMAASDLATIKAQGMYAIVGQDSVGLASLDDPTIVGWWMTPDEPDNAQSNGMGGYGPPVAPATLVTQYQAYQKADPTRPIWLGLGQGVAYDAWEGRGSNPPAESGYVPASDIVAFDIYPYNACGGDANQMAICGQFWLNAFGVDRLHQWANRKQAAWTDVETTNFNGGTAGPTPVQTASEVWLSLIHEANGIVYFLDVLSPTFREDGIFENPAMVTAVTALNKQILSLAPELNSTTVTGLVTTTSSSSTVSIDTMVKTGGSSIYVFSAVSRAGTATASYAIAGLTGNGVATVVGENRTVPVKAGKFSDAFAANAVHIYQIDLSAVTCP